MYQTTMGHLLEILCLPYDAEREIPIEEELDLITGEHFVLAFGATGPIHFKVKLKSHDERFPAQDFLQQNRWRRQRPGRKLRGAQWTLRRFLRIVRKRGSRSTRSVNSTHQATRKNYHHASS
jgi:hypothetical protein